MKIKLILLSCLLSIYSYQVNAAMPSYVIVPQSTATGIALGMAAARNKNKKKEAGLKTIELTEKQLDELIELVRNSKNMNVCNLLSGSSNQDKEQAEQYMKSASEFLQMFENIKNEQ